VGSLTEGQADHTPQIWVYDVDADGLNDIITSSAHGHGIFWYKQVRNGVQMSWPQHVIDKSWSQAHSITLADLDGDGDLDFVTGKRFFAHNGNDPDAHSPLGVYWYELRRGAATEWAKHVISYDEGIGSGRRRPRCRCDGQMGRSGLFREHRRVELTTQGGHDGNIAESVICGVARGFVCGSRCRRSSRSRI
jgi:hypothetical protein